MGQHSTTATTFEANPSFFGLQVPGTQLFSSMERLYSPEGNATLPPDWKHLRASALGPRGKEESGGSSGVDLGQSGVGTESLHCLGSPGKGLGWDGWRAFIQSGEDGAEGTPNLPSYQAGSWIGATPTAMA